MRRVFFQGQICQANVRYIFRKPPLKSSLGNTSFPSCWRRIEEQSRTDRTRPGATACERGSISCDDKLKNGSSPRGLFHLTTESDKLFLLPQTKPPEGGRPTGSRPLCGLEAVITWATRCYHAILSVAISKAERDFHYPSSIQIRQYAPFYIRSRKNCSETQG